MSETDWAKLLKNWFPVPASRRLNQVRWAGIEPHRDYVQRPLETTTVTRAVAVTARRDRPRPVPGARCPLSVRPAVTRRARTVRLSSTVCRLAKTQEVNRAP
ncbi:hypothetical protein [Streptomyces sp. NPDC088358]|uniref:hypothetical protein n=1 Tax=Streptomyces sp. NPDC088358 TaxID=3365857 RepID=UPI00382F3991